MGISGLQYRYGFMRTDTSKGFQATGNSRIKGVPIRESRIGTSLVVPIRLYTYRYEGQKPTVFNGYKRIDTMTSVPVPYAPEVQIWLPKAPQRLQTTPNGHQRLEGDLGP
ncbi:hypothetical protein V6N13_029964 [Hibiscus sabdariffa]